MYTLNLSLSLWRAAHSLYIARDNKPFPRSSKLCPALITKWNTTKGGVDVDTRLSANNPAAYQHMGVEMKLWDTVIMKAFTVAYHMQGWCTIEPKLDTVDTTDSLVKMKRRESFHDFLILAL